MATYTGYRILPNGDLFAPRRGNTPPPCPEGYVRASGDAWLFHPDLKPCKYRKEKLDPGCRCKLLLWCDYLNQQIRLGQCKECKCGVQA